MSKILLDTNVLLDWFDDSRDEHENVQTLLRNCIAGDDELYVAATSCKDVYYVLSRIYSEPMARDCIQSIFIAMELLPVDNRTAYAGFRCNEPDFEDGTIRACAELNHMDYLVTRDADAFKDAQVKVLSPTEMLAEA